MCVTCETLPWINLRKRSLRFASDSAMLPVIIGGVVKWRNARCRSSVYIRQTECFRRITSSELFLADAPCYRLVTWKKLFSSAEWQPSHVACCRSESRDIKGSRRPCIIVYHLERLFGLSRFGRNNGNKMAAVVAPSRGVRMFSSITWCTGEDR